MQEELENGRRATEPHLRRLADGLAEYLQQDGLPLVQYRPGLWSRFSSWAQVQGERLGRKNHLRLIKMILAILGLYALLNVIALLFVWLAPGLSILDLMGWLVTEAEQLSTQRPAWLVVRLALQTLVGLLYLFALVYLWRGRDTTGMDLAIFAALLSLTAVELLSFYLDQFGALAGALAAFGMLLVLLAYRAWYLQTDNQ
jgi:hypothetical protein